MKALALTGVGIVSTLGVGRGIWNTAWKDPRSAQLSAHRAGSEVLDMQRFAHAHTCEVWGWDPPRWLGDKGHRHFDRLTTFLTVAASLALRDANIKDDEDGWTRHSPQHVGIASATAYGSLDAIAETVKISELEDPRYINPTRFPNTVINSASGYVSIREQLKGPNTTMVSGNCGALDAIWNASTHLSLRRSDAMLVGGGEVVSESIYIALEKLGLLGPAGQGITVGEGACFIALERDAEARSSGQTILARLTGYGASFEPPKSDAQLVHHSGDALERAMRMAMDDAKLNPKDIDLICLAENGMKSYDEAEAGAVQNIFNEKVARTSTKRIIGETFGAAGAFALAATLPWLHGDAEPQLVAGGRTERIRRVLINSLGFYGNASSVVIEAPVL